MRYRLHHSLLGNFCRDHDQYADFLELSRRCHWALKEVIIGMHDDALLQEHVARERGEREYDLPPLVNVACIIEVPEQKCRRRRRRYRH